MLRSMRCFNRWAAASTAAVATTSSHFAHHAVAVASTDAVWT